MVELLWSLYEIQTWGLRHKQVKIKSIAFGFDQEINHRHSQSCKYHTT